MGAFILGIISVTAEHAQEGYTNLCDQYHGNQSGCTAKSYCTYESMNKYCGSSMNQACCMMKTCPSYTTQNACESAANRTESPQMCEWSASSNVCNYWGGGGGGGGCDFWNNNISGCINYSNLTIGSVCDYVNLTNGSSTGSLCVPRLKACSEWKTLYECTSGTGTYCTWNGTGCNNPEGGSPVMGGGMNPGCEMFMQESACGKTRYCKWLNSQCVSNGSMPSSGLSCSMINDSTFCSSVPMLASCCAWNTNSSCQDNWQSMNCHSISSKPTGADYCDDYNAHFNQTLCLQIAGSPWYMPCKWDTTMKSTLKNGSESDGQCRNNALAIFGSGGGTFFDIGSESNCNQMKGVWKSETYIDASGTYKTDSWCEMSIGMKDQKQNCDTTCWACEMSDRNGNAVTSLATAQTACQDSLAGCTFHTDSNAFNSYGWCDYKAKMNFMGLGDCNKQCFNCVDQSDCVNSTSNCTWFNDPMGFGPGWCDPKAMAVYKDCSMRCQACMGQPSCASHAPNCTWNTNYNVCMTNVTGLVEEVCFLPGDEDGDGALDCADANCTYEQMCGFGMGGTFSEGMMEMGAAMMDPTICFRHDGDNTSCQAELTTDGKKICYYFIDAEEGGLCDPIMGRIMGGDEMSAPPVFIGADSANDTTAAGRQPWLDIAEIGVHDTPESYDFGIPIVNITDFAGCYKQYQGKGTNKTGKYYRFLDTDGNTTNGCNTTNDAGNRVTGFEYFLSVVSYMNNSGSNDNEAKSLKENTTAYRCTEGIWAPFSATLTLVKEPCEIPSYESGLGFNGVQVLLIKKQDLQYPKNNLRVFVATANHSEKSNYTNAIDTAGPFYYTPGAAGFSFEDCFAPGQDKDGDGYTSEQDPDCKTINKFGFIPHEGGPACTDGMDNDFNSLTDCADPVCMYDPFFCGSYSMNSPNMNDHTAPQLKMKDVNTFIDGASITFKTNEPTNGTVKFYNVSSTCAGTYLNLRADTTKKVTHTVTIRNANTNWTFYNATGYYYKLKFCDPSGNCAESGCLNFTTAANIDVCTACKMTMKFSYYNSSATTTALSDVIIQYDWNNDGTKDAQQSGAYGVNTNYTQAANSSISLGNPNTTTPWAIEFADSQITKDLTSAVTNITAADFKFNYTNSSAVYVGMDHDAYTSFIDETHARYIDLQIPGGNFSTLWHCTDNLDTCTNVTTNVTRISSNGSWTEWRIPTGTLGLGMSVYGSASYSTAAATTAAATSSSGGAGTPAATTSGYFPSIEPGTDKIVSAGTDFGIHSLTFQIKSTATSVKVTLQKFTGKPAGITEEVSGTVFKYFGIEAQNLENTNIALAKIKFAVDKAWLTEKGYSSNDVRLFRHTTAWDKLAVTPSGEDADKYYFDANTPGFSTFVIAAEKLTQQPQAPEEEQPLGGEQATPTGGEGAVAQPTAKPASKTLLIAILVILVLAAIVAAAVFFIQKKQPTTPLKRKR